MTAIGLQPPNLHKHAIQLIAEATALLTLDSGRRQKLSDQLFEAFIKSVQTYATKAREQSTSNQTLDKLNQIHHLAKSSIAEDITLIKNAVNNAVQPPTLVATWGERVKSGGPPSQVPTPLASTTSCKEREIVAKLNNP